MMIFIPSCAVPVTHNAPPAIVESAADWKEPSEDGHQEREDYTPNGWNSRFANSPAITGAMISDQRQSTRPATDRELLETANSALRQLNSRKENAKKRYGYGRSHPDRQLIRASRLHAKNTQITPALPKPGSHFCARRFIPDRRT